MFFVLRVIILVSTLNGACYTFASGFAIGQDLNRRQFLSPSIPSSNGSVKVAFFDADSTLRVSKSGAPSANNSMDYMILPGVPEKLRQLNAGGYLVAIVSNQGGIPRSISFPEANRAFSNLIKDLKAQGARIDYYDFAEKYDFDRKPSTGMGERLKSLLSSAGLTLDKENSFMVGDSAYKSADAVTGAPADTRPDGRPGFNFSNSDRLFAEHFGIRFIEPQYFFNWIRFGVERIEKPSDLKKFEPNARPSCEGLFGASKS